MSSPQETADNRLARTALIPMPVGGKQGISSDSRGGVLPDFILGSRQGKHSGFSGRGGVAASARVFSLPSRLKLIVYLR